MTEEFIAEACHVLQGREAGRKDAKPTVKRELRILEIQNRGMPRPTKNAVKNQPFHFWTIRSVGRLCALPRASALNSDLSLYFRTENL